MSSLKFMNDPDVTPEDAVKVINALSAPGVSAQIAAGAAAVVGAAGGPLSLLQTGIPFVLPSSGSVGNEGGFGGRVTGLTGLPVVYGFCYCYFPAGAVYSGSVAGWWLTNLSGATNGYIHDYIYEGGQPSIPSPLPSRVVQSGPGAYTQTTAIYIPALTVVISGGQIGPNGALEWDMKRACPSNANNKGFAFYLGGQLISGTDLTTQSSSGYLGTLHNRGVENAQVAVQTTFGDPASGSMRRTTVDTSASQIASIQVQLAAATDFAVIEACSVFVRPKA